jgi:antirestriction protein ArdC
VDRMGLYEAVTSQVVAQIEAGAGQWRMPWHAIAEAGEAVNALTGAAYRGGNHLVLGMVAVGNGWSGHWGTYKQWQQLGAQVRRGERGTHGVKWSVVEDKVIAAEQVDGWQAPEREPRDTPERLAEAEAFFSALGADVRHGGNRAAYSPSGDYIVLPEVDQFDNIAAYYGTSAHEHAHWSGHPSRLDRNLSGRFGSDAYAAEELVAELSAAFTCAHLGISAVPRPDHAAYLSSWLRVLRADSSALFHAASKAQAATDFLLEKAKVRQGVAA